ncbi:hypothetical protein PO909_007352 [Leuciscus waleckii]
MMFIFGLMLMLKTAACVERFCWFNQEGPCYVALGDKLSLMMPNARGYDLKMHNINYSKQDDRLCKIKNNSINKDECDLFKNRHDEVSVNNGILIINTVIRADSGNYRLQVFNSEGTEIFKADLQVIIDVSVLFREFIICSACAGLVLSDDGSVGSVRRFSHLHETHVRKETGRSKRANEKI